MKITRGLFFYSKCPALFSQQRYLKYEKVPKSSHNGKKAKKVKNGQNCYLGGGGGGWLALN